MKNKNRAFDNLQGLKSIKAHDFNTLPPTKELNRFYLLKQRKITFKI